MLLKNPNLVAGKPVLERQVSGGESEGEGCFIQELRTLGDTAEECLDAVCEVPDQAEGF